MTIQEAILSRRAFRRKGWKAWIQSPNLTLLLSSLSYRFSDQRLRLSVEDILANDWEVETI